MGERDPDWNPTFHDAERRCGAGGDERSFYRTRQNSGGWRSSCSQEAQGALTKVSA